MVKIILVPYGPFNNVSMFEDWTLVAGFHNMAQAVDWLRRNRKNERDIVYNPKDNYKGLNEYRCIKPIGTVRVGQLVIGEMFGCIVEVKHPKLGLGKQREKMRCKDRPENFTLNKAY